MSDRLRHKRGYMPRPMIDATQLYCDAPGRQGDPTGTFDIRRKYKFQSGKRWRQVISIASRALGSNDILGLKPDTISTLPADNKLRALQAWFSDLIGRIVVENSGEWLRPMIQTSYTRAIMRAMRLTKSNVQPVDQQSTVGALWAFAVSELQGIAEAATQQVVRECGLAVLHGDKPAALVRRVGDRIRAIGITRSEAMIELMTVKAFSIATLDQFKQAGVQRVGLVPELVAKIRKDRALQDAPLLTGPGARIARSTGATSLRTIQRIRKAFRAVESFASVNVETAGDADVCPVCEDIEEGNPYTIGQAYSLIPAHPRCRCAFVPVDDEELGDSMLDSNPYHDPHTGEFTTGPGAEGEKGAGDTLKAKYGEGQKMMDRMVAAQPEFDRSEIAGIQTYTGHNYTGESDYQKINSALREGHPVGSEKLQKSVDAMDSALSKTSVPEDIMTYRALVDRTGSIAEPTVGSEFVDKGFSSTSVEWHMANDYQQGAAKNHYLLRVHVPKGSKALAIGPKLTKLAHGSSEREVILPRGSKFRVTGKEEVDLPGRGAKRTIYNVEYT